ncbi:hypothetical protein QJS10_CPA05g00081 [Acorus calamus]|uniref:Protein transport protein SEC23 n=1 Tax=Acorus calamus TaxID=4465 RepID=A0AAV9ET09_ACOCL|nr:hypothetical protein QJS10_CPA05g00081 [Acorus calamus]
MSSPPQYSNGLVKKLSHSSESIEESDVIGQSPYMLFSAHKILKNKKLGNVSSLGFGALVSPGREIMQGPHIIYRDPHRPYRLKLPEALRDRCLGAAVEVALAIIQGPSAEMSRNIVKRPGGNCIILVCVGGPNTYGPDAVPHSFNHPNYPYMEKTTMKWMEHLGNEAHRHDTVVDVLCAGQCPVRVPVLQPLAKASGGVLVLHDDFGEAFGVNLQRASTRAAGSHGIFEIRCSNDILVAQMPSVEEPQCFALSMETKGDIAMDERVRDIALQFGSQQPMSKLYQFPKELSSLPENLFHLRRGPLLGSIVGHEDERSVLRNLFLNASFDLSLRMLALRCLMHREEGTFEELPAYDLSMQSDSTVILDHGTYIFIWLEGSSQARYFVSRLIPAHKDPPYEQETRFPQLRSLSTEQRARLKSSFIHFDDLSYCEWMCSLKLVPP